MSIDHHHKDTSMNSKEKNKKQMEKQQFGCMTGLLHIFDRQQFLAGKRVYATTKRLASSPSSTGDSTLQSEKSEEDLPLPEKNDKAPIQVQVQNATEFNQGLKSPWKFRESPRLSLDSRAIIDNKGSVYPREIRTTAAKNDTNQEEEEENEKQRRSPSVVARLMGLEMLPAELAREPLKKQPELRRTNSESKCTDLAQQKFLYNVMPARKVGEDQILEVKAQNAMEFPLKKTKFDSQDFYRQVKEKGLVYGELEKRLKTRGINEAVEDLESLKQILEALQLKGLLHSRRKPVEQITNHNYIFDQKYTTPSKFPAGNQSAPPSLRSKTVIPRNRDDTLPPRRRLNQRVNENERRLPNSRSPDRSDANTKSPSRNKPLTVETRRRNDSVSSPTHSPKISSSPRKNSPDKMSKSLRNNRKPIQVIALQAQEESFSVSATTDQPERFKAENYNKGKSLLERCDKLLNSIAEISTPESQPSPVSVLDSSFYKEELLSPLKRCIEFRDQPIELEEDNWSQSLSSVPLNQEDVDFDYVWKIIQAFNRGCVKSDLFSFLEKESYNAKCSVSSLHRKLVFDAIMEILDKKKQLPLPNATGMISFKQVWLEFSKIREPPPVEEDVIEVICRILRKDLAEETNTISRWGDCGMEKSEMVLDIERLIFKDLVGDTIQELATFRKCRITVPKKLVF